MGAVHNTYIKQLLNWGEPCRIDFANRVLRRLHSRILLRPAMSWVTEMSTVEHRMNLFHLTDQVCAYGIPGAVTEFGSFVGETAVVIGKVLTEYQRLDDLHLYDTFEMDFTISKDPLADLYTNFENAGLGTPENIHRGRFEDTLPKDLPSAIALCHIDCGYGGPAQEHAEHIHSLLQHVYPRISPGGIIVFTDYCDPSVLKTANVNPGVKDACDTFFRDKEESVSVLWAGDGAQGYVRIPQTETST